MENKNKPVAYEVRNGLVSFQIWSEKEMADRVAAEQQKRHDLSGSLAAFHVVPLYEHQQVQVTLESILNQIAELSEINENHAFNAKYFKAKYEKASKELDELVETLKYFSEYGYGRDICIAALTKLGADKTGETA